MHRFVKNRKSPFSTSQLGVLQGPEHFVSEFPIACNQSGTGFAISDILGNSKGLHGPGIHGQLMAVGASAKLRSETRELLWIVSEK